MWLLARAKTLWKGNPIHLLLIVVSILVVIFLLWKWMKQALAYVTDNVKAIGSTLSKDEAQAIASFVFAEVNSMATNEDAIVERIGGLTLSNYYKVKAEFGIQPYSHTFDNFDSLTGTDSNLTEVLNQTLSENDKEKIKSKSPWLPIS